MSIDFDLYLTTSGQYRLAFVQSQIASVEVYPQLEPGPGAKPGMLGTYDGLRVVHPSWYWGATRTQQSPRFLLILRSGTHALAIDSYRIERLSVQPAPLVLSSRGLVYGVVGTPDGLTPVLDLACVPLA